MLSTSLSSPWFARTAYSEMPFKDSDICTWLLNKLGHLDQGWTSPAVIPQLNRRILLKIRESFPLFLDDLKIKTILAFLHMSKPCLEENKEILDEIIELGRKDTDDRVAMFSEIIKTWPSLLTINLVAPKFKKFRDIVNEFTHDLSNEPSKRKRTSLNMDELPMEYAYLNPSVLELELQDEPKATCTLEPIRPFIMKRPHKSLALREELLQKSKNALLRAQKSPIIATIPFLKSSSHRLESSCNKEDSQSNDADWYAQFLPNQRVKRSTGPILIDIAEQPNHLLAKKKSTGNKSANKKFGELEDRTMRTYTTKVSHSEAIKRPIMYAETSPFIAEIKNQRPESVHIDLGTASSIAIDVVSPDCFPSRSAMTSNCPDQIEITENNAFKYLKDALQLDTDKQIQIPEKILNVANYIWRDICVGHGVTSEEKKAILRFMAGVYKTYPIRTNAVMRIEIDSGNRDPCSQSVQKLYFCMDFSSHKWRIEKISEKIQTVAVIYSSDQFNFATRK